MKGGRDGTSLIRVAIDETAISFVKGPASGFAAPNARQRKDRNFEVAAIRSGCSRLITNDHRKECSSEIRSALPDIEQDESDGDYRRENRDSERPVDMLF